MKNTTLSFICLPIIGASLIFDAMIMYHFGNPPVNVRQEGLKISGDNTGLVLSGAVNAPENGKPNIDLDPKGFKSGFASKFIDVTKPAVAHTISGVGTNNLPQYLMNGVDAPIGSNWSKDGTVLGFNLTKKFNGNYLDVRGDGGKSIFSINAKNDMHFSDADVTVKSAGHVIFGKNFKGDARSKAFFNSLAAAFPQWQAAYCAIQEEKKRP